MEGKSVAMRILALHVLRKARYRQRRTVGSRHEQTLEDKLVVSRIRAACKEAVELEKSIGNKRQNKNNTRVKQRTFTISLR